MTEQQYQTRSYQVKANSLMLAIYTCQEPLDWDDDMGLFHKNESSWCSGNVFDACEHASLEVLQPELWDVYKGKYGAKDQCPCMHFSFELVPKS